MLSLYVAGTVPCPRCAVHAAGCKFVSLPNFALRSGTVSGLRFAKSSRCSSISQQKRRLQCHAKKSKKKKRSSENFEERPVNEDAEAAVEEPLDSTEAEFADTDEAASYVEALDEEPVQEQQQYHAEAAAPPPQASTRGSDMIRLGGLGLGAVALIVAVVFAIKKFAKQKLPEEEKVRLALSGVHSQIGHTLMQMCTSLSTWSVLKAKPCVMHMFMCACMPAAAQQEQLLQFLWLSSHTWS